MEQFDLNENIIARLGLQNLPEEKRLRLLEKLTEIVLKRVTLRLIDDLPESDVSTVNALADKPDELIAFLASKVDNLGVVFDEEIAAVKKSVIDAVPADALPK
jgi:hypothetical protein